MPVVAQLTCLQVCIVCVLCVYCVCIVWCVYAMCGYMHTDCRNSHACMVYGENLLPTRMCVCVRAYMTYTYTHPSLGVWWW